MLYDDVLVVGGTFSSQAGGSVGSQFEKDGAVGGVSPPYPAFPHTLPSSDHSYFPYRLQTAQKASDKVWDAGKAVKGEK